MDKKQDEAREKMQEVISHCHLVVYWDKRRDTLLFIIQVQMQMQKLRAAHKRSRKLFITEGIQMGKMCW